MPAWAFGLNALSRSLRAQDSSPRFRRVRPGAHRRGPPRAGRSPWQRGRYRTPASAWWQGRTGVARMVPCKQTSTTRPSARTSGTRRLTSGRRGRRGATRSAPRGGRSTPSACVEQGRTCWRHIRMTCLSACAASCGELRRDNRGGNGASRTRDRDACAHMHFGSSEAEAMTSWRIWTFVLWRRPTPMISSG